MSRIRNGSLLRIAASTRGPWLVSSSGGVPWLGSSSGFGPWFESSSGSGPWLERSTDSVPWLECSSGIGLGKSRGRIREGKIREGCEEVWVGLCRGRGGVRSDESHQGGLCNSPERILSMLRHEITPSAGMESHCHRQLVADVGEVDCASRGRGRCWGCRAGAGGQSRSEGSGKGARPKLV